MLRTLATTVLFCLAIPAAGGVSAPLVAPGVAPQDGEAPQDAEVPPTDGGESGEPPSAFAGEIGPVPFSGSAEDAVAEARTLAGDGHPEQARALALTALARTPYDTEAYRVLFDVARAEGDDGDALRWGKWIWWAHHYAGRDGEAARIGDELDGLYAAWNADLAHVDAWTSSLQAAAEHASGRAKQFRVAGHILQKLLALDPSDEELNEQYDKLFDRAGEQATGGAFVAERVRSRSPKWLAKTNAEHAAWEDAFDRKTEYYSVITNISYEFFETVCVAMDDMYEFYRELYDYKRKTPRVTLAIHRKRSDFDRYCLENLGGSLPLGVGGWFYDKEMTVAAFDRSEGSGDLSDVYRVLFHEASHQFMYLLTEKKHKQSPPTWLNEGTASYFEGCEIKADGSIVKNKPALGRVREWEYLENSDRRHDLKELITCPHRRYDGSFYSYGWALVYFLNNYENEDGELVYRDAYLEYLKSYTKKGPKKADEFLADAFDRAQRLFVEEVDDPEVQDWEAFEERWRAWTQEVVRESKAGPDFADELLERGERYLARGDSARALIAAEQADDKRPNDPRTYALLALASDEAGRRADATYWMLRRWEEAWARGDEAAAEESESWLAENDGAALVEHYCDANRELLRATAELLGEASAAGHPAAGMLARGHAQQALGLRHHAITADLDALASEGAADLRLWRRAFDKGEDGNRSWGGVDVVQYAPDGVIVNNPNDFGEDRQPREACSVREFRWLDAPFDVRGEVQIDGKQGALLLLGIAANGLPQLAVRIRPDRKVALTRVEVEAKVGGSSSLGHVTLGGFEHNSQSTDIPFRARFVDGGGVLRVGDTEQPLPADFTRAALYGTLGLATGDNAIALFKELQVRPSSPFWPVDPAP